MIKLDYRTENPRWKKRGIIFRSWKEYAKILAFLSNKEHHIDLTISNSIWSASISLIDEANDNQGAYAHEGRIRFYKNKNLLAQELPVLYSASSAGVGSVTLRINSNGFIESLIDDYDFTVNPRNGQTTKDVYPPNDIDDIKNIFEAHLSNLSLSTQEINDIMDEFDNGYTL